jgi:hypothetical protein
MCLFVSLAVTYRKTRKQLLKKLITWLQSIQSGEIARADAADTKSAEAVAREEPQSLDAMVVAFNDWFAKGEAQALGTTVCRGFASSH